MCTPLETVASPGRGGRFRPQVGTNQSGPFLFSALALSSLVKDPVSFPARDRPQGGPRFRGPALRRAEPVALQVRPPFLPAQSPAIPGPEYRPRLARPTCE